MSRVRLILLSMFAVLAVGAVASTASASAKECSQKTGGPCLFINEVQQSTGETAIISAKKASTGAKLVVASGPDLTCTTATNKGKLVAGTNTVAIKALTIEFSGCEVTNTTATKEDCEVKTPIVATSESEGVLKSTSSVTFIGTATEEGFTKITIKTKTGKPTCTLAVSEAIVKGKQTCSLPESTVEKSVHELVCAESGSTLKFAGKEAKLELTETFEFEKEASTHKFSLGTL